MATSTCWPNPSWSRWRSAARIPIAPNMAGIWSPTVAPILVGGPSGKPVLAISPLMAWMARSIDGRSR